MITAKRAYGRVDDRQVKYQRPVASERELRLAIDAALRSDTGAIITLGAPIPLSGKITIPVSGVVIQGGPATPIIASAEMPYIFEVKSGTTIAGINVLRADALQPGRAGNFVQDGGVDTENVIIENCTVGNACARAVRCTSILAYQWTLRGNLFSGSSVPNNVLADVATGWSASGNVFADSFKITSGSWNRVFMNDMVTSNIDMTGSTSSVIIGNTRSTVLSNGSSLYEVDTSKAFVQLNL